MDIAEFFVQLVNVEWAETQLAQHPGKFLVWTALWFAIGFTTSRVVIGAPVFVSFITERLKARAEHRAAKKAELEDACERIRRMGWAYKSFLLDVRDGVFFRRDSNDAFLLRMLDATRGLTISYEFAPDTMRIELTELGRRALEAWSDMLKTVERL